MNNILFKYFPQSVSKEAIVFFFITLIVCSGFFLDQALPFYILSFAIIEVVAFFYFTSTLSKKWVLYSESRFKKEVFISAFVIRLIYVVLSYFFYLKMTGQAFEFGAADSFNYHTKALFYSESGDMLKYHIANMLENELSDSGFILYLTFIYSVIGQYLIPVRILNALFSAFTCVLIYKLGKRNFGESVGRLAAIMAMLLPNLIYYCGLHLKESLMVFLVVAFVERADCLLRETNIKFKNLLIVVLIGLILFSFRTVLGAVAFLSLFTALTFSHSKLVGTSKRILVGVWLSVTIVFFFSGSIENEVNKIIEQSDSNQEQSLDFRSKRKGGNEYAKYGEAAIFAPIILVAPFPTFVYIENQMNQMLLSGGYFIRNAYAFFVMLALIIIIKAKMFRSHLLIISFLLGYLAVLVQSAFAISERFHLPIVPFLLILASFGVVNIKPNQRKYYVPYLFFILIVIVGWSWFKLSGRGLID